MGKFNEYAQKATPADNDKIMIYDATAKANKLSPFSGIWNWIVWKLTNAVISNLQTSNRTVLGAINELNSKDTIYLETPANTDDFTIDMFTFNCTIRGNVVTLSLNIRGTVKTQKSFFTLCKIPSKYIPDRNLFDSYITQDGNVMIFSVLKTGEVQVYSNSVIDKASFFLRKTISYVK